MADLMEWEAAPGTNVGDGHVIHASARFGANNNAGSSDGDNDGDEEEWLGDGRCRPLEGGYFEIVDL